MTVQAIPIVDQPPTLTELKAMLDPELVRTNPIEVGAVPYLTHRGVPRA